MLAAHTDAPIVSRASEGACIVVADVPPSDAVRDATAVTERPIASGSPSGSSAPMET
jgi:hypothetical protein